MRSKYLLTLLLATAAVLPSAADDFGVWTSLSAEHDFSKRASVELSLGVRAEDNLKAFARWDGGAALNFTPAKFLKLGAGFVYIYDRSLQEEKVNFNDAGKRRGYNVDHGFWRSKYRFYFDASLRHTFGRFKVSLRERYQVTDYEATACKRDRYRSAVDETYGGTTYEWNGERFASFEQGLDEKDTNVKHYLRSRLQVEYNIRACPLTPYASYELSNNLSEGFDLDKKRLCLGTAWKVAKHHTVSLGYLYQTGVDDDGNSDLHAVDLSYKFKF